MTQAPKAFRKTPIAVLAVLLAGSIAVFAGGARESSGPAPLTVATVNNPDMAIMQQLSVGFTSATGIGLNFVVLPENELRQKVTEDVGLGSGKYDVVTIGTYDAPIWGRNKWLVPLESLFAGMSASERQAYDREDLLPTIRAALSFEGQLFALPFYGESSMMFYRKDLFAKAGLSMSPKPTWQQIYGYAARLRGISNGCYGIVLRGLPGWGENLAPFNTVVNAFGGRWFRQDWQPAFDEPGMAEAWRFYKKIIIDAGEPSPTTDGYTECLAIMASGKAAMWYDATVSAGALEGKDSKVAGRIGYAFAPSAAKADTGWLWAWALAIERSSRKPREAFKFLTWATDRKYIALVGSRVGWAQVPPGTRSSTYHDPRYLAAAPFADIVLSSILSADYDRPTLKPVPYKGLQYVSIPEFQSLGELVSQQLAAYLAGQETLEQALMDSQAAALRVAKEGGYLR
ncbi:MAG TPA: sugar ABC transporter substrate-binding protein [Spirochaetia bacterium]|nr:sugar ABC transporter substrate-binding protein [Spirochaetia bacterium]